jgi:hypothetical protein
MNSGPWFVCLMMCENRYELVVHTYAYRIAWMKGDGWYNAQMIGPVDSLKEAESLCEQWKQSGQKNKQKLLDVGRELSKKYKLWTESLEPVSMDNYPLIVKDILN